MRKLWQITISNLQALPGRWGNSLATIVGMAAVVGVLTSTMMMTSALQSTMDATSRDGWIILVREGAVVESMSSIPRESLELVRALPATEQADAYPHFVTNVVKPRKANNAILSSVLVRGLSPRDAATWDTLRIIAGRNVESGRHELIAGTFASQAFEDLTIGSSVPINGVEWQIVGLFEASGAAASELRGDLTTLMEGSNATSYSSIRVNLPGPTSLADLNAAIEDDRRLTLDALPEDKFFQIGTSAVLFEFVAYLVSTIMALGATFASINVMYTSIDNRTLEIATLRALGFPASAITASILAESTLLALTGGALGLGISWVLFHGATYTSGSMSSIVAPLALSPGIAGTAVVWAVLVGLAAGLPPAIRANRMPIADGLRWEG